MPDPLIKAGSAAEDFTPTVIQEWLPDSLMACFVVGIVERLDLNELESHYGDDRKQASNLRILLALLFHGYTSGIFSSRELEQATYDSDAFRFITANTHPGHALISSFRKRFLRELEGLFVQIMVIARTMGLISKDEENLDSDTLKKRLHVQAASLLIRAEKADARDRQQQVDRSGGIPERESGTAQAQTPSTEINEEMPNVSYSTYTFLSRKGAVQAQASSASRSYINPWAIIRRPVLVAKTLAAALFRKRPQRRRPVFAYRFIFLLVLSGSLLLTHYFYRVDPMQPGSGESEGVSTAALRNKAPEAAPAHPRPPVVTSEPAQKTLVKQGTVTESLPVHRASGTGAIQRLARSEQPAPVTPAASSPPDTTRPPTARTAPVQAVTHGKPAKRIADDSAADPLERAEDKPAPGSADTGSAAPQEPAAPAAAGRQHVRSARNQDQSGTPHREDWLLDQTGNRYMLQLLGTRYENALLKFIERHKPDGPLAYYRGIYKGKDWYVLLYGDFPSNHAAMDAIKTLPKSMSTNRPWPRTMRSIQAAILEARIR